MRILSFLAVTIAITAISTEASADTCKAFKTDYESAEKNGNLSQLAGLYGKAKRNESGWSEATFVYCLGRRTALAHVEKAYSLFESAAPKAEVKAAADKALTFGAPWQALHAKAELQLEQKTSKGYGLAAQYFQQALNDIAQVETSRICHREIALLPDKAQSEKIYRQAVIAVALADDFIEPPRDRAGEYGGIFLPNVRGFTPKARPIPITFEYDKATFTPKGEKAAKFLLDFIKNKKFDALNLSGHTDERGSDTYNMELSRKRLAAVKSYLKQGGYQGKIRLLPKGESEPFAADDRGKYSDKQLFRLDRRVELRGKY